MDDLGKRIRVAMGEEPADFVVAGASVFNAFIGAFEERDVLVAGGHVASVLPAGTVYDSGVSEPCGYSPSEAYGWRPG